MARQFVTVLALLLCVVNGMKMFSKKDVLKPFINGNALKVISGLQNFDSISVQNVANAAYVGGASHVDIACDAKLVSLVKSKINIPICVSSIVPSQFVEAVAAGADMIEIGNFDSFYSQGISFTSADVLEITRETRSLLPDIPLSVTIPYHLSLSEQIELAQTLESMYAVDIIQTEGKFKVSPVGKGIQEMIEIAAPTIASAYALSRAVKIPVMCASGLTDVTVPLAIASGARGVGIGSMVSQCKSPQQMIMAVTAIAASMGRQTTNTDISSFSTLSASDVTSVQTAPVKSF